mgnify:CR=1 FL=1
MTREETTEAIQWAGAGSVIAGHTLNAVGPAAYPWNIVAFSVGTALFFTWSLRVKNQAQLIVNVVAIITCSLGLYKAFF